MIRIIAVKSCIAVAPCRRNSVMKKRSTLAAVAVALVARFTVRLVHKELMARLRAHNDQQAEAFSTTSNRRQRWKLSMTNLITRAALLKLGSPTDCVTVAVRNQITPSCMA